MTQTMAETSPASRSIEDNIKLVAFAVSRIWGNARFRKLYLGKIGSYEDAMSDAIIIFYRVAELYDDKKGSFSNYLVRSIHRSLWKKCRCDGVIKSPGYSKNHKTSTGNHIIEDRVKKSQSVISISLPSLDKEALFAKERNYEREEALLKALKLLTYEERAAVCMFYGIWVHHGKQSHPRHISNKMSIPRKQAEDLVNSGMAKLTEILTLDESCRD